MAGKLPMTAEFNTLITSGAYIGEEMQAEFGRIPPAFLPVGSAYLVQHQLRHLDGRALKWLSLPSDFELSAAQQRILDEEGVRIVLVNPKVSLGMSVFQSILEIDAGGTIEILHGDTLLLSQSRPTCDAVSVAVVTEQYKWGLVETDGQRVSAVRDVDRSDILTEEMLILSGYFAFHDAWQFLKCLVSSGFSFVAAIDEYARDKTVLAEQGVQTLDFGHQKTFYASRKHVAATRHFNSLRIDDYVVTKESNDTRKIDAEAHWLRSVPPELQPFTARLIEDGGAHTSGKYTTLYSSFPTVAELYLAQSSPLVWRKILDSCQDFLCRAFHHSEPNRPSPFSWLVIEKLRSRIACYPDFLPPADRQLTINGVAVGTLEGIVGRLERTVREASALPSCVMHGDFCFSNMLFDPRSDRILLIDPRGLIGDETTLYGDIRYDIAKLGHSIVGRYDQIVGQHLIAESHSSVDYTLTIPHDPLRDWLEEQFLAASVEEISFDAAEVRAAIVSLFLAMIPLHSEDPKRQQTLFANALRLFALFFEKS